MASVVCALLGLIFLIPCALTQPTWGPCVFNATANVVCANVTVPKNWNDGDSEETLFTYVSLSQASTPKGTIWFLNGGSGVSSECMVGSSLVAFYNEMGFDVGLPDFRGAGHSRPKLFCPGDPDGYLVPNISCAQHYNSTFGASGMYNFSITMAAHDLAFTIRSLSRTPYTNFVQGDSFGTFWGQRFLQIFPDLVTGAVIESFGVPNRWNYFEAPDNIDWAVRRTLQYCSLNISCNAHLGAGTDAYALAELVLQLARNGSLPCTSKLAPSLGPDYAATFSHMLAELGGSGQRDTFGFIPALIYRWARCDSTDVAAIEHLFGALGNKRQRSHQYRSNADACDISQIALYNLFFSEGIQRPVPSMPAFTQHVRSLLAAVPIADLSPQLEAYAAWPTYALDQYGHRFPNTSIPILLMNGDLDISTPYDNAVYSLVTGYNRSNVEFVHLPMAPHVSFLQSPQYGSDIPCGVEIIIGFFLSNGTNVDRSCVQNMIPLDWMGATSNPLVAQYFGTADLWQYNGPQPLWIN